MTIFIALSRSAGVIPDFDLVILPSRIEVPYASGGDTDLPLYSKFLGPLLIKVRPSRSLPLLLSLSLSRVNV